MNNDPDRLYTLLPSIYRQLDAEQGWPLRALLRVIAEQVNNVENDIDQLYENWFIETCQDWIVPYIGDLIGYQLVHEAGEPGDIATAEQRQRNKILIPRRDVAHTIHHRRRKGTLKLLEELARDVAGWPARAVEFYRLLGRTEDINALQPSRGRTGDVRNADALDYLDGPFDEAAHTVDVRKITSPYASGRYNIPNVGLFVWRLNVYSVTRTRARLLKPQESGHFTFSILGNDTQLYTRVQSAAANQQNTTELNFPIPIRRWRFERDIKKAQEESKQSDYYGEDKSLFIWKGRYEESPAAVTRQPPATRQKQGEHPTGPHTAQRHRKHHPEKVIWEPVPIRQIRAADLSRWQYKPHENEVAVDPVLGRLAFATNHIPEGGVRVLYHYAFSADIGGGEYHRPLFHPAGDYQLFRVSKGGDIRTLQEALELWEDWKENNPGKPRNAIIEITDSSVYIEEPFTIELDAKENLQIRAANHKRPVIHLEEERLDRANVLRIAGIVQKDKTSRSRLTLDGLLIFGQGIQITGDLAGVTIRHCTLAPGWDLEENSEPKSAHEASLILDTAAAHLTIEQSILGSIVVSANEVQQEPIGIKISDSILDAADKAGDVLSTPDEPYPRRAYANLTVQRSTVIGGLHVHAIELAENSIFTSAVRVARSQIGCMRFCYVPGGSRTPPRYNCQPDLVSQAVKERLIAAKTDKERRALKDEMQREIARVAPVFNSERYGTPDYCQLAHTCAEEIKGGADDEAEMGVFHDLFQPQRAANLRARLDEYTPADMEAGIIYID